VEWQGGRLRRLALRGKPGARVPVRYRGQLHTVVLNAQGRGAWTGPAVS
jgi:hypothetical protein